MNITYPIFILGNSKWDEVLMDDFYRYDDIYYSSDEEYFQQYYLNSLVVDSNGSLFKIIGKSELHKPWYLFFISKRNKIHFEDTQKKIDLEDLKLLFLKKIEDDIEHKEVKNVLIESVQKSTTIKELISNF